MSRLTRLTIPLALTLLLPLAAGAAEGKPGSATPPPPPAAPVATDLPGPVAESPAEEDGRRRVGDKVAIGTSLNVAADEVRVGSAVCIGCRGRIDGKVLGDIVVVGGKLEIAGSGIGQLIVVGSQVVLEPGARIDGDVVNVGGRVTRDDGQIGGEVTELGAPALTLGTLGGLGGIGGAFGLLDGLFGVWFTLLTFVLLIAVLALLAALVPDRIRRIAEEVPVIPVPAFLWGLLAYVVLPFAILLLIVSCIGIPVLPFAYFAFKVLKWLGMAGIFLFVGRRIGRWFQREIPLLGAVLLGMIPFLLIRATPLCVGWLAWFVLEIFAVGYVIATRAGRPLGLEGVTIPAAPFPSAPGAEPSAAAPQAP